MTGRRLALLAVACGLVALVPAMAAAQSLSLDLGAAGQAGATSRLVQMTALIAVLSLAPSLLVMVTAFTRIVIVLSLLRSALSTQGTRPNMVLIGLALFLTYFVMQLVLDQAWTAGLLPMSQGSVPEMEGLRLAAAPFHRFMTGNVRGADLKLFLDLANLPAPAEPDQAPWCAGAGIPGGRAAPRLRDRLPVVPALPGHRHGGGERADEPRDDDAATERGVAAVQADLLRADRRVAVGGGEPGAEFSVVPAPRSPR
jgi:FliP family